ncbi:MAG: cellulase family glycosylhydrolase [Ignavibacteriales bacterium]|nr:cellulase family glycosylhydrolase [Ignavibacteriales bacterium]
MEFNVYFKVAILKLNILFLFISMQIFSQSGFFKAVNNKFFLDGRQFTFFGFNAYYLQSIGADSSKLYIIDDVFKSAKDVGVKVIRTNGFFEADINENPAVIRYSPDKYNENGLKLLDYVIFKAKEYGIYLILSLSNNYKNYGGIPQYLKWGDKYSEYSKNLKHNDFFVNDTMKIWYKDYLNTILNRTNHLTNIQYKDETNIFSFELMNEADMQSVPSIFMQKWYDEMSRYFRSIDKNHLLTTGEIGYDANPNMYSDIDLFYNGSKYLFNGYKGTSYYMNSLLNVDYASFHLYPEAWGLDPIAGITWIEDHIKIADELNKPALMGEFGVRNEKLKYYDIYLEKIRQTPSKSCIVWNYLHPDIMHMADAYAFNEKNNPDLFTLFTSHISLLDSNVINKNVSDGVILFQNYPNPFNPVTTIKYSISEPQNVSLKLFNILGEQIGIIDEGFRHSGEYEFTLSFDNERLASGLYIYQLVTNEQTLSKKLMLLK